MRWAGLIACMGRREMHTQIQSKNEDLKVYGWVILTWILSKWDGSMWTG
jgi:hypothetical protein